MDTKIKNGGWVKNSSGLPQTVECSEELLQRVLIRLTVPLGSFVFQPSFGSRLYLVWREDENLRAQRAVQLAQEALKSMTEVKILSARVNENTGTIIFNISFINYIGEAEITVGKNL